MKTELSNREAANIAGVSHVAIAKAKETGRLATLPNGKVPLSALTEWMARRTRGRKNPVVTNQFGFEPCAETNQHK